MFHLLQWTDSPDRKISKKQALNDTLGQWMDLIDMYKAFYLKIAEYTSFSSAHRTFTRIDHLLGQKRSLVNLRKLKSHQASFPTKM